jgi:hypothetical protein
MLDKHADIAVVGAGVLGAMIKQFEAGTRSIGYANLADAAFKNVSSPAGADRPA